MSPAFIFGCTNIYHILQSPRISFHVIKEVNRVMDELRRFRTQRKWIIKRS